MAHNNKKQKTKGKVQAALLLDSNLIQATLGWRIKLLNK